MQEQTEEYAFFTPEKSGSCLIAGFHQQTESSPSYFHPYGALDGDRFSVDMVRMDLTYPSGKGEELRSVVQTFPGDEVRGYQSRISPGGWYELWSFGLGDSSVALGIGFFETSCRLNINKGFIEFNPNKVCGDPRFETFLLKLSRYVAGAHLRRFDLAYDIARARSACRLSKDRRTYKCIISGGITEYLGQKNVPGYVKVYDKAKEQDLKGVELTRIELTCSGDWSPKKICEHWPEVHRWSPELVKPAKSEKTAKWCTVLGKLLAERAEQGLEIESYVDELDWRQKEAARELLRTDFIELPELAANLAASEARAWCARVSG